MTKKDMKTVDIKGKKYIEVNERLKYFNENYKKGRINTEIIKLESGMCVMRAEVMPDTSLPERLFTGTAYEKEDSTFINKTSYIENCETSAVGRALAMMGIGIVGSIASADEVVNAVNNQNTKQVICSNIDCRCPLTDKEKSFSMSKYNKPYCYDCQQEIKNHLSMKS